MSAMRNLRRLARRRKPLSLAAMGVAAAACSPGAFAAPENAQVASGSASVSQTGNLTTIQAANNTIINYSSFNIGSQETVRFIQPDASSRVLNRITGAGPTTIEGQLLANGRLYFVNPNGIYFAGSAVINVGGLYAAGGAMSDQHFLSGEDRFTQLAGSVVNEGLIQGGSVHLMGASVANRGTIDADRGIVTMVAGDNVYLMQHGSRMTVQVDGSNLVTDRPATGSSAADAGAPPAVENTGIVKARNGQVLFGAGDMVSLAIRNRGVIAAEGGDITLAARDGLVANEGLIDASTDTGPAGAVLVQGSTVLNTGVIRADAAHGQAGTITVHSDHGTVLSAGSILSATGADLASTGGNILVHSYHGRTDFAAGASIDVSAGGHGGNVEVSGMNLGFAGDIDLSGGDAHRYGTLLIDPVTLLVTPAFVAALPAGNVILTATQDIYFQASIARPFGNSLTATAPIIYFDLGSGSITTPGGSQTYNGQVLLRVDVTLTGNGVVFSDTLASDAAFGNQALHVSVNGSADFHRDVGGAASASALDSLHVTGPANLGRVPGDSGAISIRTIGSQTYDSNVNLIDDVNFIVGDPAAEAHFRGIIHDANATLAGGDPANLVVVGNATFGKPVTEVIPLGGNSFAFGQMVGSLRVTGRTHIHGEFITTVHDQTYEGKVTFADDIALDLEAPDFFVNHRDTTLMSLQGNIRFGSTVDAVSADPYSHAVGPVVPPGGFMPLVAGRPGLAVIAPHGHVSFAGDVGVAGGLNEEITPDFLIVMAGVNDLTPLSGAQATHVITFGGSRVVAVHDILLNADESRFSAVPWWKTMAGLGFSTVALDGETYTTHVPDVATIAAPNGNIVVESLEGDVAMGRNNKFTTTGRLDLLAAAGEAWLGDLNAFVNSTDAADPVSINVEAVTIHLQRRAADVLLDDDGSIDSDQGLDIVAQRGFRLAGALVSDGDGGEVRFGSPVPDADLMGNLDAAGFEIVRNAALVPADFDFAGVVLDLTPQAAPTDVDTASLIAAGPLPFLDRMVREPLLGPPARQAYQQLAVDTRDLQESEYQDSLLLRRFYSDLGQTLNVGNVNEPYPIAINRIRRASAIEALEGYRGIFQTQAAAAEGGVPGVTADQTPALKQQITGAWAAYVSEAGSGASAMGFRDYLGQKQDHAEARRTIERLGVLMASMERIGITPLELDAVALAVLGPVAPEGMTARELFSVVTGRPLPATPPAPTALLVR